MEKENVIISEGERPIWQFVIAALFFTLSIFFISYFFYRFGPLIFKNVFAAIVGAMLYFFLAFCAILMGMRFSAKNTMFFDLENNKFKDQYTVGPFIKGKWKLLPKLEYVSVFKNSKGFFEINIWHRKNKKYTDKHFNIYNYHDEEEALETGYYIAKQLNIKLLDATEKGNFKYLDMVKLKEKYKG